MTSHSPSADHSDHHHDHRHNHDEGPVTSPRGVSLLSLSVITRCAGAACLLVPLWVAVLWVINS